MPSTKPAHKRVFQDRRTGIYQVHIHTPHGRKKFSLGTRSRDEAEAEVKARNLDKIDLAARAGVKQEQALSRIITGKAVSLAEAVELYLENMAQSGRTPRSIANHSSVLKTWLAQPGMPPTAIGITTTHVRSFVQRSHLKRSTMSALLSTLATFLDFCANSGFRSGNPARVIGKVDLTGVSHERKESHVSEPFTDDEVRLLLESTDGFWRLAVAFAYWSGLRLSDIAQLEPGVFQKPGMLTVWTDKRDKRVEVPIEEGLAAYLHLLPIPVDGYYWPEQRAKILDPNRHSDLSVAFGRILTRLGIKAPHKSFKSLRATCAQRYQREGRPIWWIAKTLGHASQLTTIKHYVQQPAAVSTLKSSNTNEAYHYH